MSKFRIAMAVAVLASLSASPALARGLGLGGVIGGVRSVLAHVLPLGVHRGHHSARESHIQTEGHIQTAALEPQGTPDVALGRPSARGQIVAAAALAGWHDGRASSGWWRPSIPSGKSIAIPSFKSRSPWRTLPGRKSVWPICLSLPCLWTPAPPSSICRSPRGKSPTDCRWPHLRCRCVQVSVASQP